MLYALVNNDYQLRALRRHGIDALTGGDGAALIIVPHAMAGATDTQGFLRVHRFETPLGRKRMPAALWHYREQARHVKMELRPGSADTLVFFTEVEWLNQILVQHFHRSGARTVMLEDGGFGTYVPMSVPRSEPLNLREKLAQALYRQLPGLGGSQLFKLNGQVFPRLADSAIDEIVLYRKILLHRRIQVVQVQPPMRKPCQVRRGSVVFLNERMYDHYQTAEAYLAGLRRLLSALVKGFEKVWFKFHPREPAEWKDRILALLSAEFPSIEIIGRPGIIEDLIENYRPAVLASYFSTALLNIEYEGVEPLYLYHLLDDVKHQPVFSIVSKMLKMWNYHFVNSDSEIRSDYISGIATYSAPADIDLRQVVMSGTRGAVNSPARVA